MGFLQALISALGRQIFPKQKYLFIKFLSWNVVFLDFIRKSFPGVPWLFLYRHPLEVAVSSLRIYGVLTEAKAMSDLVHQYLGISELDKISKEEFHARMLASYCNTALKYLDDDKAMLVNYNELSTSFLPRLLSFFKIEIEEEELPQMKDCFNYHSKDGMRKRRFVTDSHRKIEMASPHLKEMIERYAMDAYAALENKRNANTRKNGVN